MATKDYNDFVHTGPGTPAGSFMRLFWQPIYRVEDLAVGQAVPVRIMSEDLTLYRGQSGVPHLLASRCAHRGTMLSTGWVEEDCIRCFYHGWKYNEVGQCVEQPGEEAAFAGKVKIRSYPTEEYLGLIFAYLGEGEPSPFRHYPDVEREGVIEVGVPERWPCNYFNRIDNACDSGHVPWTHRHSLRIANLLERFAIRKVDAEETEWGILTTTTVEGIPPSYLHFHMPNTNQSRSVGRVEGTLKDAKDLWVDRLFWRVPVDDENSVSFVVDFLHLTGADADAYRERRRNAEQTQTAELSRIAEDILAGKMQMADLGPELSTYKLFWIEDYVAQVGQGPIADRSHEGASATDVGVSLLRKMWRRELKALAEGRPLKQWHTPAGLADMSVMTKK